MGEKKTLAEFKRQISQDPGLRARFKSDLADLLQRHGVDDPDLTIADDGDGETNNIIYLITGNTKTKTFIV